MGYPLKREEVGVNTGQTLPRPIHMYTLGRKGVNKPRKADLHLRLGTRSTILGRNEGHPDLTSAREYRLDQTRQL